MAGWLLQTTVTIKKPYPQSSLFRGTKKEYIHITPRKSKTFPGEGVGGKGYKTWFLETDVFSFKQSSFVQFIREAQKKKLGILRDRITFATKPVS